MGQLVFQATAGGQVALVGSNPSSNFSLNVPAVNSTLATLAAQTFTGQQTDTVDASINGLTVGKGGGSQTYATAFGVNALGSNTTGYGTAIGYNAGNANSTGVSFTAVGAFAGQSATAGYFTAVGQGSLSSNTTGIYNTAVGTQDASGYGAMRFNTTGSNNVGVGTGALAQNTTASNNTAVGYQAGYNTTTGTYNVYLGAGAASSATTGIANIVIGASAQLNAASDNYELVISPNSATGKGVGTGFITAGSANNGALYQGNNSTLWSITSDQRIKENVETLTGNLDIISKLRPVSFNYKTGDKKKDISFIAQEYQQVLPDKIVEHAASAEEKEITGTDKLLGLTPNLIPYLVGAIQELTAEVNALKAKLGA